MPDEQLHERGQKPADRLTFPQPAGYHLAQINLARAVDDLDKPAMAEFMAALDKVNAIAAKSPGYVWRLTDPVLHEEAKTLLGDPRETYTLSVWDSADALEFFAWNTVHRRFRTTGINGSCRRPGLSGDVVIPQGTTPDFANALARLEHFRAHGPRHAHSLVQPGGRRAWHRLAHCRCRPILKQA